MKEKTETVPKQMIYLLFVCVVLLAATMYLPQPKLAPFISAEVQFYDPSTGGLKIMPASCASNPAWGHGGALPTNPASPTDSFKSSPGTTEAWAWSGTAGMYVCVTNTTGSYLFIPAKTAAELNAFKAHPPAGVSAW